MEPGPLHSLGERHCFSLPSIGWKQQENKPGPERTRTAWSRNNLAHCWSCTVLKCISPESQWPDWKDSEISSGVLLGLSFPATTEAPWWRQSVWIMSLEVSVETLSNGWTNRKGACCPLLPHLPLSRWLSSLEPWSFQMPIKPRGMYVLL